ncbi:MAG: TetR/AcrR family transcriptional regulator, partial [Ilumatobacter sp.]|nr:TetR/AcrR family transcriptional regulator [Ilumatobacter sp.]
MGASSVRPAEAPTQSGWERRQERTRAEVLAAAGEIIAAEGLEGLTMRKLAARAGVAVATLYNQFGDRDGVLVAFVSNGLDQLEV